MSSSVLELTRSYHENLERYSRAICEEFDDIPKTHRDNTSQLYRVDHYLKGIIESSEKLAAIYEDKDGARKDEINAMSGTGPNLYSSFYERLRGLKDYHRRFPGIEVERPEELIYVDEDKVLPLFSGEEAFGQCLDLHEYYERFINLKGAPKIDYLLYLDTFSVFRDDQNFKNADYKKYLKDLGEYLINFLAKAQPLVDLTEKFKALDEEFDSRWTAGDFKGWKAERGEDDKPDRRQERRERAKREKERIRERAREKREEKEREKREERERERKEKQEEMDKMDEEEKEKDIKEDKERKDDKERDKKEDRKDREERKDRERDRKEDRKDRKDRDKKEKREEREDRDDKDKEGRESRKRDRDGHEKKDGERGNKKEKGDKKKEEEKEEDKPVWCEACKKEFAKSTVYNAHLKGKKHLKADEKMQALLGPKFETLREVYHLEYRVHEIVAKLLSEQLNATKNNIEKKQSKTWEEMKMELEEEERLEAQKPEEKTVESESEEEPEIKLTIDNYPTGWDGKPIPYWLYKLHGLGVEYRCEICGNASYWGRKAYEKHFQEWRHAHGMRCLGIPNTRHFHDITKINDAVQLYEKIKYDNAHSDWKQEAEEEFEDKEGNVFNKKTYEDLRRQNLL